MSRTRVTALALTTALLSTLLLAAPAGAIETINRIDGDGGGPVTETSDPRLLRGDLEATQWHLDAIDARGVTNAESGDGTVVAILADGVWAGHPDLTGRVLAGYDILTGKNVPVVTDRTYESSDAYIGTFAAALIAGSADRAGIRGVAPGAKILPIIVEGDKAASDASIADGINWAVTNGADLIVYTGSLTSAYVSQPELLACSAVTAAKQRGVLTFTPAGSDFDVATAPFALSRCADVVSVAPLSTNLSEANGFKTNIIPTLAAPGMQIVSAYATIDWVPYASVDLADWAAAITAGAFAALMEPTAGVSRTATDVLAALLATATDLDAAGRDARTGAGLVDLAAASVVLGGGLTAPRTAEQVAAALVGRIVPDILSVRADTTGKTGLTWLPPTNSAVTAYTVTAHRYGDGVWTKTNFAVAADAVRAVVDLATDGDTYFTVTAASAAGDLTSLPTNAFSVEDFEEPAPADAKVTSVKASWNQRGIVVEVTTNEAGKGATWYATVLDGWTTQPLLQRKVKGSESVLIQADNELRKGPLFVLATINGERVYAPLLPEFLVDARGLAAGASHAAVSGSTQYACTPSMNIDAGCEGKRVRIIDAKTKKTIATTLIASDLSFLVVFPWKSKNMNVYAVVEGDAVYRSALISRVLVTRK